MPRVAIRGGSPDQRIIEAALELFMERGYSATTVDAIASRARVSKATMYLRFQDKEAILRGVVADIIAKSRMTGLEQSLDTPIDIFLPRFASALVVTLQEPKLVSIFRLLIAESGRQPELGQRFYAQVVAAGGDVLARYLEHHGANGDDAKEISRVQALQFIGMLTEVVLLPQLFGGPPAVPESHFPGLITKTCAMFLSGLRASP